MSPLLPKKVRGTAKVRKRLVEPEQELPTLERLRLVSLLRCCQDYFCPISFFITPGVEGLRARFLCVQAAHWLIHVQMYRSERGTPQ